MSGGLDVLQLKEEDVNKLLAAQTHLGAPNLNFQMAQYVFKRSSTGAQIIDLRKTWEKLLLAARAIAAIEYPADVCVISSRPEGQRAVLKFAFYTGTTPIAGRFTPGAFTNHQRQACFREPRLLVVTDPRLDHQPIREASYVNIPVIALCNTDSPLRYVDIAIPCNTKTHNPLGLMWWMLAREVLRLRGSISRNVEWGVMPDLFFYRAPEEVDKEAAEQQQQQQQQQQQAVATIKDAAPPPTDYTATDLGGEFGIVGASTDWASTANTAYEAPKADDSWGATPTTDWSATVAPAAAAAAPAPAVTADAAPISEWGGTAVESWDAH